MCVRACVPSAAQILNSLCHSPLLFQTSIASALCVCSLFALCVRAYARELTSVCACATTRMCFTVLSERLLMHVYAIDLCPSINVLRNFL